MPQMGNNSGKKKEKQVNSKSLVKGIQFDLSAATGALGILDYEAARNHQTCCAERSLRQIQVWPYWPD